MLTKLENFFNKIDLFMFDCYINNSLIMGFIYLLICFIAHYNQSAAIILLLMYTLIIRIGGRVACNTLIKEVQNLKEKNLKSN